MVRRLASKRMVALSRTALGFRRTDGGMTHQNGADQECNEFGAGRRTLVRAPNRQCAWAGQERPFRQCTSVPSIYGNTISILVLAVGGWSRDCRAGHEVQRAHSRRRRAVPAAAAASVCLPRAVLRPTSAGDDGRDRHDGKTGSEVDALVQEPATRRRRHPGGTGPGRRQKQSRPKVASEIARRRREDLAIRCWYNLSGHGDDGYGYGRGYTPGEGACGPLTRMSSERSFSTGHDGWNGCPT